MGYYEEIFTRLNRAKTTEEITAIRDEAAAFQVRARVAGNDETAVLAADIVKRATEKLTRHKPQRARWVPLSALNKG